MRLKPSLQFLPMSRPPLPLVEIAQDWITVRQLGDAPNTVEAKMDDLVRVAMTWAHLQERDDVVAEFPAALRPMTTADLSSEMIIAIVADLGKRYQRSTAMRTLSSLRVWCRWMTKKGYLDANPCDDDDIRLPRLDLQSGDFEEIHSFNAEEVALMMEAARRPLKTLRAAWPLRDVAILQTLAGCGVRASELVGLQVRHVDRAHRWPLLRVVAGAKGSKPRTVPIPSETVDAIDEYLGERTEQHGTPDTRSSLFVRRDGRSMNRVMLDRLIRRVVMDAGVSPPEAAMTHGWRHFYATTLSRSGIPVPTLQQLLGHADSRTTAKYTRLSGDDLAEDLEDIGWL